MRLAVGRVGGGRRPRTPCYRAWWQAVGTRLRSPCALVESGLPLAGGIVGAGGELQWPNPTRPGESLQVESEVLDITPSRSRPDRGVAVVRSLTRNQP